MNLISDGNTKLHNVAIFDLPAKDTCLNHSKCWRSCYAYRQQQYWHLAEIRKNRHEASKLYLPFIDQICKELQGYEVCRIHSSGDFYSNVNIISSILPNSEVNYAPPIVLNILKDKYPEAYLCKTPHPYVKGYCMGECKACLTEKMVLFEEHHGRRIRGGESWSNNMWQKA